MKLTASIPNVCSIPGCTSVLVMLVLVACSPATAIMSPATATAQATATIPQVSQKPVPFPLSEPGLYHAGARTFTLEDASRKGREVGITMWYPAVWPADSSDSSPTRDANPDLSSAPYPLILSSAKVGNIFAPHLASHGFVVAGVTKMDSAERWGRWLIDYPLDIVFALDQIASNSPGGLEGMIDANHAGAMGYSFDGYNALALSGARVDPEFYLTQCAEVPAIEPVPPTWWIEYICDMPAGWEDFVAHASDAITVSNDGLWQPLTDERIRAVMPMAPEGAWLFGERGLAAVNRPTLIIGATEDDINIYDLEAVYIFEHLGTPNRTMISFVGEGHMMVYDADQVARMKHFATAFFGYYLQGRDDYAGYFSEDFVAQHDDLAWGVYTEK
jgi:predicted dienelactone hydrolase